MYSMVTTVNNNVLQIFESFVVLEKTLESPLDCKEIQPVHPKGNRVICNNMDESRGHK